MVDIHMGWIESIGVPRHRSRFEPRGFMCHLYISCLFSVTHPQVPVNNTLPEAHRLLLSISPEDRGYEARGQNPAQVGRWLTQFIALHPSLLVHVFVHPPYLLPTIMEVLGGLEDYHCLNNASWSASQERKPASSLLPSTFSPT